MSYGVALRNGVPFTLGTIAALCVNATTQWNPLSLWPDGIDSPGMWISPRTLTSEWQDYTGTTPVVTPGTVADSSNPVGLAYDLRAGTPVLGPELVTNGDFSSGTTGWSVYGATLSVASGECTVTNNGVDYGEVYKAISTTAGKTYRISATVRAGTATQVSLRAETSVTIGNLCDQLTTSTSNVVLTSVFVAVGSSTIVGCANANTNNGTGIFDNISVREVPGNHMLQSTSAARPLMSAYDGQTLGPGNTYDATGFPIAQLYDGVDDGMATAAFSAGTLINGMDCLIPVRRDSAAACVAGLYNGIADATKFFGMAESASGSGCVGSGAGTPTVWVDGVQLSGGTAVTRGTLHTALTVGDWHILEFRGLDLSTWTAAGFGLYTSYLFNGPRGDIFLFPSTASTEDKDAARQYLATYYGVTLP